MRPNPDRGAAGALGEALRRLGYGEDALLELLGDDAYSSDPVDLAVHERRLPPTRLGSAARLLFLQEPVARDDASRALGERGVEALSATRLARVGRTVTPRARVSPVRDLLVASDGWSRGAADPPDYVATYTPTSRLCDVLTPRPRVARALDVGTGNGVHALLAARHARRVVATDVNPRALAYTELNEALNGLENVETRRGGLFEPAGAERFDLITCNAPFVVSPESRWAYRDGSLPADELSEQVVRGAVERLAPDGWAALLVSWVAGDPARPHERALRWLEGSGCDAWVLGVFAADPLEHAAGWNAHLAGDELGRALDRWTAHFEELGVRWITEGGIVLRRTGGRGSVRVDDVDDERLERADHQLRRAFANRGRLDRLGSARLARAARVELSLRPRGARVRLEEGTHPELDVPVSLAEALAAGRPPARAHLKVVRELAELGIVEL